MFVDFFLYLRSSGLPVTLVEWLTLAEGLRKGLHHQSLTGFYHLCRAVTVKSEKDADRFDRCFTAYFRDLEEAGDPALTEELLRWLEKPDLEGVERLTGPEETSGAERDAIRAELLERLAEQDAEHNEGKIWVGTEGYSHFGNRGKTAAGIRVGGVSAYRRAFQVAGERTFRDFRQDAVLDVRQFQLAFRALRQFSTQADGAAPEFDVDGTVRATADNAGRLQIRYRPPRRNTVKLLLLMDSGGSMEPYAALCTALFRAAQSATHLKDLQIYYFHNCVGSYLYTDPTISFRNRVPTDWVLHNTGRDYRVILVGDALMEWDELFARPTDWKTRQELPSGMEWLQRIQRLYRQTVWLNPVLTPPPNGYWGASYRQVAALVDMFPLTVEGLHKAMKHLLVSR